MLLSAGVPTQARNQGRKHTTSLPQAQHHRRRVAVRLGLGSTLQPTAVDWAFLQPAHSVGNTLHVCLRVGHPASPAHPACSAGSYGRKTISITAWLFCGAVCPSRSISQHVHVFSTRTTPCTMFRTRAPIPSRVLKMLTIHRVGDWTGLQIRLSQRPSPQNQ